MIVRRPKGSGSGVPLFFVHGAFAGAWCWDEHFLPWFAGKGWTTMALDLPGRRGRADHAELQNFGISDYLESVLEAVDALPAPPVVIGHSMGGYLAWKVAERRRLAGLVLMAPVPPTGLAAPALQLAISKPDLFAELTEGHTFGNSAKGIDTLHSLMFSDAAPRSLAVRFAPKFQSESKRAIADQYGMSIPNLLAISGTPVHVVGAGKDPLIPAAHVHYTAALVGRMATIHHDMGHGMMLEDGWRQVAEDIADWLTGIGLCPA